MYKKQITEKLRSQNVSPIISKENNSYAKKYSRKLLSRQSINQEQENFSEYLTITQNSSPINQCSTNLSQQQQIVQQQKREISILKLGCSKCLFNQNRDLNLRQKIIMQNKQILELMSKDASLQDQIELQRANNQLQKQNDELKQNQDVLKMNQQQILQENLLLKNLLSEQNCSQFVKESSSQIFSISQSQGMFSSIYQFNSQLQSTSQTQSIMERGNHQLK